MTNFSAASYRQGASRQPPKRSNELPVFVEPESNMESVIRRAVNYVTSPAGKLLRMLKKNLLQLNYVHFFCIAWVALIWYGERTYPYSALEKCAWSKWETWVSTKLQVILLLLTV